MTPDELLTALTGIVSDIVGAKGQWRKEPLTLDEWHQLDDAWLSLKQHDLRRLARDMGRVEDR